MVHPSTPKSLLESAKKVRAQLEKYTPRKWNPNFSGLCGLGSALLLKELKSKGIQAEICENNSHAFVRSQGFILDVTATQFGYLRIVALPAHQAARTAKIWHTRRKFSTLSAFRKHQKKHWPAHQQVERIGLQPSKVYRRSSIRTFIGKHGTVVYRKSNKCKHLQERNR